jgi:hypothetical protein
MPNTFEDYIVAVKSKYEVEKDKIYSDFLLKPTPAQIRDFCLIIHDNGMSNRDKEVFELFFKTKPDSTLRKAIEKMDVEKFKKICNFLNNKSLSTSQNSLNLVAILVGYELRPFSRFLNAVLESKNVDVIEQNKALDLVDSFVDIKQYNKIKPAVSLKKKISIGILSLIGVSTIGYTAKNIIAPDPQCMQWQINHYEIVDCQSDNTKGLMYQSEIVPFNENQSQLIKIEVTDTTTFFKNGKPMYWYCKVNGKPEFFNTHGLHPETNKALRPVSEYIVDKYFK